MRFELRLAAALLVVASFTPSLRAETETSEDKRQLASSFVTEKLAVWQKRLHLEDWTISVVMSRKADLKQGTMGKVRWDKRKKTATIWAMDVDDYALSTE